MTPERFRQIQELYHSARQREPAKRSAWLAEVCRFDPDIRGEVESLLAVAPPGDCFLDKPAILGGAIAESANSFSQHWLAPGLKVGPYVIEDRLGAGGMGVVYKALDTKLGRRIALKFLPPHLSHDFELRKRLGDEARAASALDHPNIVVIHSV